MEDGEIGNSLNAWGVRLFETIRDANAKTFSQQTAYAKWLDQTSDREAARQDRIHGASGITPLTVWLVLLISAAIVFAYMLFFADPAEMKRSQAMLVGSATTIVVVTHNQSFAESMPRVVTMRDGKIDRDDKRDVHGYRKPEQAAAL